MNTDRNFNNYVLGDNVYQLAEGLIPEIAERLDVSMGEQPNSEALSRLVGVIGKNKVLRNNAQITAYELEEAGSLVLRSGVQEPLSRSLWSPDIKLPSTAEVTVITGGMANWQDRLPALLTERASSTTVYAASGNRTMDEDTELTNKNVLDFQSKTGNLPSESEYISRYVLPKLGKTSVKFTPYDTDQGNQIASSFVQDYPELFADGKQISFARVANAGIQLAAQFRKAARAVNPRYDADKLHPQVFVLTDSFPIAETAKQLKNPRQYQSPFTALRMVALTAKMLHEAAK